MDTENILKELTYKAVKSSGAGGQHVNKVSSKIILSFTINTSNSLTHLEKKILHSYFKNKLTKDGVLILTSSKTRSQHKNKEIVVHRFFKLLAAGLAPKKTRKTTKPNPASILKKIENKRRQALKKSLRRKPEI